MPKKRLSVALPKGRFATSDLVRKNPHVSRFVLQCRLRDWLAEGVIRFVGKREVSRPVKAHYVYERVKGAAVENGVKVGK